MAKGPLDFQLTEKQFALIGKIAVESALTEYLVEALITRLAEHKDISLTQMMLKTMMVGGKIDLLRSLATRLPQNERVIFCKLIKEVDLANQARKLPIHGIWAKSSEDGMVRAHNVKKPLGASTKATELAALDQTYKRINRELSAWIMRGTIQEQQILTSRKSAKLTRSQNKKDREP